MEIQIIQCPKVHKANSVEEEPGASERQLETDTQKKKATSYAGVMDADW